MKKIMMMVAAFLLSGALNIQAQNNWMERLDDNRLVADLSLPGTHDAATAEGWSGLAAIDMGGYTVGDMCARGQDLTIEEQWNVGVRVFDIRPQKDGDVLRCMHGITGMDLLVADFFAKLRDLLAASPSEFAIVATKIDTTTGEPEVAEWAPMFEPLIHSEELRDCFVEFKPTLTVGEMRGKILLLSRNKYADVPLGGFVTGWSSDKSFFNQQGGTITGSNGESCPLWMQDYYNPGSDRMGKEKVIRLMLDAAMARDMSVEQPAWVMNYTAGNTMTALSDGYRENAVYAHQLVLDYLSEPTHTASTGIVFMDFAGVDQSKSCTGAETYDVKGLQLVEALIAQNFRNVETGIKTANCTDSTDKADGWYSLNGVRQNGKPTMPGIYVYRGKKVVIK